MIRIEHIRPLYEGWLDLLMVTLRAEDGALFDRHVVGMKPAVAVLPFDEERRVALVVSMPRTPVMLAGLPDMLEAIAGQMEDEPEDCARREAQEEAGVRLNDLLHLGKLWSMPSVSSEAIDYFLAGYRLEDRIAAGGGLAEEHEHITVHEVGLDALWQMLSEQRMGDAKLAVLTMALRLRRPDLFTGPVG